MPLTIRLVLAVSVIALCLLPRPSCAIEAPIFSQESLTFDATPFAPEGLRATVYLPPGYDDGTQRYPVLYLNDGQDRDAVHLAGALAQLTADGSIRTPIAVAIDMPRDRMGAYGLSDRRARHSLVAQTRYGPVGAQAHAYSEWVARTLVPAIDARYRTRATAEARTALGWSLGALNAFNLGWQYPELFGRIGAFSPSFWVSADRGDAGSVQGTRLAQRLVDSSPARFGLRLFVAVGSDEERDDRDRDGLNDALDDARDLIDGWRVGADVRLKGLRQLGYRVNLDHGARPTRADVALFTLAGGRHDQASWARMLPPFLRWAYAVRAPVLDATGRIDGYQDFPSAHVPARDVDVWLPPSYGRDPQRRYPVLYMHDGQNLFDPALSYTGVDWDVDGAMTRLIAQGRVREAIVVGIWSTPQRIAEYLPRAAVATAILPSGVPGMAPIDSATIRSDAYLRFLVEELKPFIDASYATSSGRGDTAIMGSSMGGLISLYAAAEHPDTFGAVGALSTHWPIGDGVVVDWLSQHMPPPRTHRLYFDHGTATLDALYAPFQQRMDDAMRRAGYRDGDDWLSRRFEGADHSERAWRDRLEVPLEFLLGP